MLVTPTSDCTCPGSFERAALLDLRMSLGQELFNRNVRMWSSCTCLQLQSRLFC
jgi:hypothetical protein